MPTTRDWRTESEPAALNHIERHGFAWEFLRRNQDYRAGYERITAPENDNTPEVANAAANFARHWGLICTAEPKTPSYRGNGAMAPGTCTNRRTPHACAGRVWQRSIPGTSRFGSGGGAIP